MPVAYRQKIVEAFRDNAVRSVLLIDDEYLPYENLAKGYEQKINDLSDFYKDLALDAPDILDTLRQKFRSITQSLTSAREDFMSSAVAREFVDFFHQKKLVCDVENQTQNLDKDKVRKSDLIILDYHLQKNGDNPAERSLNLISELSHSKHMNMVVVYTAETLNDVWFQIAATLRGTHTAGAKEYLGEDSLFEQWMSNETDWKSEWDLISNAKVKADYLMNEHNLDELTNALQEACTDNNYAIASKEHVAWLLEQDALAANKNRKPSTDLAVYGERSLWLQAGDIFVVLCEKKKPSEDGSGARDVSPEEVWAQIKTALESWYPSFYRVIISELQNQIEDANVSMEKVLAKGDIEQIAALWGVLRVHDDEREQSSRELVVNLLSDVVDKVQSNTDLLQFIKETACCIDENLPQFVSRTDNTERHRAYLKDIVKSAYKNVMRSNDDVDVNFRAAVLHAFNEQLSIEKEVPNHISTGVILRDIDNPSYYLCISPACNTVPNQITGDVAKRMSPHRPMRFIKLVDNTVKLVKCLKDAHQSDTIFITDISNRLALSIFEDKDSPTIEQGVVVEHDTHFVKKEEHKIVHFFATNRETKALCVEEKRLVPIAKLRAGFASRYQNVQLQYEARIGVDLVSCNMI